LQSTIDQRLAELGLALPDPGSPGGNYVPYVIAGDLVFVSGQVCRKDGRIACAGKVGRDVDVATAQKAAQLCALNLVAHVRVACGGDLDRVVRCVRLSGFVNSDPEFKDHPAVINGASDLMIQIFGDRGRHARTALGVAALPSNASVEVEGIFQIAALAGSPP
jgi:enamine deaminase RidA (YjgF/YER057c/UK114 family)